MKSWLPGIRNQDWVLAGHVLTFGRSCLSFEREVLAEDYPPDNEQSTGKADQTGIGQGWLFSQGKTLAQTPSSEAVDDCPCGGMLTLSLP